MTQKSKRTPFNSRQIFLIVLVVFIGLAIVLSVVMYSYFYDWGLYAEPFGQLVTPEVNAEGTPLPPKIDQESNLSAEDLPIPVDFIEPPVWDGKQRVTVLVMGVDYRDWEAGFSYSRTDTMMLLTIDPVVKTAGALSIPRDLWAAIPGFKPSKINAAHYFGGLYDYPGGGPALAVKTVENVIGVPIDYYVRLDFNAFVEFIDLIGGVIVTVEERIELEQIGKDYDVVLEPGRYTLNGREALAYARNRYNEGGDFDRARRQQQIIMGVRQRLRLRSVWGVLVSNAPELYDKFTRKVATNMPLDDALRLAALAVQVEQEDIDMAVIGLNEAYFGRSPDNLSILVPYPDKIRVLRDRIFATGGAFSPGLEADLADLMQLEGARVVIYDGAADGGAIAQRTADFLRDQGMDVVSVQPAGQSYSSSSLVDHTGSPYTMAYLSDLMGIGTRNIFHRLAMDSNTDVEVWIGSDWRYNNTLP